MYTCLVCGKLGFYVCPYCLEMWIPILDQDSCGCDYEDDEGFDEGFCHLHCLYDPRWVSLYCHEVFNMNFLDDSDDEGIFDC